MDAHDRSSEPWHAAPPYPTVVAACADVHHRVSGVRAFACWQLLQLQVPPQLHASPHWHEAAGTGAEFWQPQVHWVPAQVSQTQTFD